jgi:hypothetical protein|nr:MAG TPA: putative tail fiber [Caudoviricetes sp.]
MSFKPRNFREWCNHTIPVLPQVYGDELSYYELLNKVIERCNSVSITVNELINYVNHYFDSLDVQKMIDAKLDEMAQDGTLADLINNVIFSTLNNSVNKRVIKHLTALEMINDAQITLNDVVITCGYYKVNDNGNAIYHVLDINYGYNIPLSNGLFAYFVGDSGRPEQFGCKGDDSDDTTGLKNLLNTCKCISFTPNKKYGFSSTLTIKGNTTINGNFSCLHSLVIDVSSDLNDGLVKISGDNCVFTNIKFDGGMNNDGQKVNKHTYDRPSTNGRPILDTIAGNNYTNILIENCIFENATAMSIQLNDCDNVTVSNCQIRNSNRDAIFVIGDAITIVGNIIEDCEDNYIAIDTAFITRDISDIVIAQNTLKKSMTNTDRYTISSSVGIFVGDSDGRTITKCNINNNTIESNYIAVKVDNVKECRLNGNDIRSGGLGKTVGTELYGLYIRKSPYAYVTDNHIICDDHTLFVANDCDGIVIQFCEIVNEDGSSLNIIKSYSQDVVIRYSILQGVFNQTVFVRGQWKRIYKNS